MVAPVVEMVAPVVEMVAPVVEMVAPVVEMVAPVVELVGPVLEMVALLGATGPAARIEPAWRYEHSSPAAPSTATVAAVSCQQPSEPESAPVSPSD